MQVSVPQIMRTINSTFDAYAWDGSWRITGGILTPSRMLLDGDWIRISGSMRNDGIYQVTTAHGEIVIPGAVDEAWQGTITLLKPPPEFLNLCEEIIAYAAAIPTENICRETFGEYSVEHAVDANGVPLGWQQVFAAALLPYRKLCWRT